jgi:hypothetical protein
VHRTDFASSEGSPGFTIASPADAVTVLAAITSAVSDGEITRMEASELSKVVDSYTRAVETRDIVTRLDRLEAEKERK